MSRRLMVAGAGNVFLGDDGFGVAVAHELAGRSLPEGVEVVDAGIRGVHLAYDLLDGCDLLILVDTVGRGEEPGTLYVIEPRAEGRAAAVREGASPLVDAHGMTPEAVLSLLETLGGPVPTVLVVGCEPASTEEGMELTPPVRAAVPRAADLVVELIDKELAKAARVGSGERKEDR